MERVTGIGGLFFRAREPKVLARWYQDNFGITVTPSNYEDPLWPQEAGPTVFEPFPDDTDYFGEGRKVWTYPNGRFARLYDPEGNPIELWQPVGRDYRLSEVDSVRVHQFSTIRTSVLVAFLAAFIYVTGKFAGGVGGT